MKYLIDYQYLPKGSARPVDDGSVLDIEVGDDGFTIIPAVGDYVQIDNSTTDRSSFSGRVKTRLFSYLAGFCMINIVIEETDDDWGALIKQ